MSPKYGVAEVWWPPGCLISQRFRCSINPPSKNSPGACRIRAKGRWTINAAIDESTPVPVLSAALFQRFDSRGESDFANKLLSAMRFQFGGHVERKSGG